MKKIERKIKKKLPKIECFENRFENYEIIHIFPEFTSLCPISGLPDFGKIIIKYVPNKWCVELKSLKFYLNAYREVGVFYEDSVNQILNDIVKVCAPISLEVTGVFNPRGGFRSVVKAKYFRKR